ncbi:16S rRNA (cytosine(1402)-N(4))-methyltransferase RsmH [Candidatus Zinderia endosymbiont of Aphrophora alni]|uniref:16S rRNA (cytosine(1402)-N(4))-methyltransferase RsmH n=1 Tax=Candidatus Zinderia endosymbiont of Aphrophora alni TaxID=3077951 RepID=UPI0030D37939
MKYNFNFFHYPVLLKEVIKALNINHKRSNGIYVDCTFGGGGHSLKILKSLSNKGKLIALEKDPLSIINSKKIKDSRFSIFNTSFVNLEKILLKNNIKYVDGILMDLGISLMQINDINRGFSFKLNGFLDMRINNTQGLSAKEWLVKAEEKNIFNVIKKYGEEKYAFNIAKNIILYRKIKPILTTFQLSKIIQESIKYKKCKGHLSTKTFQAIRIFINNELEELKIGLKIAFNKISKNGRLVIISFHSLEDKIVKKFMKSKLNFNIKKKKFSIKLFRKIKPNRFEIFSNSHSRSAIMRYIERIF